jgi:hypothetical protein
MIAIVVCGGWGVWRVLLDEPAPAAVLADDVPRRADAPPASVARSERVHEAEPEIEQRAAVLPAAATPAPESASSAKLLCGRVLDAEARPQRGIEVAFHSTGASRAKGASEAAPAEDERVRSSGDGRFSMPMPADAAYATVMAGCFEPRSSIEPVVVVAEHRPLAGRVIDEEGHALPGARIELALSRDFGVRFEHVLDATRAVRVVCEADASGAFELARAPIVSGSRLVTALAGYRSDSRAAPDFADRGLEIVLARERAEGHALHGIVVAPDGSAVAEAHVALGSLHERSDANGEFTFDLSSDEEHAVRLVAAKRGFLPAEERAAADTTGAAPRWPDYVRLRLGGEPARLTGRVVDQKGEPVRTRACGSPIRRSSA